jgi:hypothetical protein
MHTVALTGWLVLGRLLIYDPYESIGENPQKGQERYYEEIYPRGE